MNNHLTTSNLNRQLKINLGYTVAFAGLSLLAIVFIDQRLALWVHYEQFDNILWLNQFTENSPYILGIPAALIMLFFPVKKSLKTKLQIILVSILLLIIADLIKSELKCLFARNWPLFWLGVWGAASSPFKNNYGINFSWTSHWQGSLPSGHTTFVTLLSIILAQLYPRLKPYLVAYGALLVVSLVSLNHHFLGDCLAGISLAFLVNSLFLYVQFLILKHTSSQ